MFPWRTLRALNKSIKSADGDLKPSSENSIANRLKIAVARLAWRRRNEPHSNLSPDLVMLGTRRYRVDCTPSYKKQKNFLRKG